MAFREHPKFYRHKPRSARLKPFYEEPHGKRDKDFQLAVGFFTDEDGAVRPLTAPKQVIDASPYVVLVPKAPRRVGYSTVDKSEMLKVADLDVKQIAHDNIHVYFDGDGNVISQDVKVDGEWWSIPRLGTTKLRTERVYTRKSIDHPAKMNPLWAQKMIQEYSRPGDTILDPMAGIGTTGLEASRLGRNAVLVDLEDKWIGEMRKNSEKLKCSGQMKGAIKVRKGDATSLNVPSPVDVIMFSPPYGHEGLAASNFARCWHKGERKGRRPTENMFDAYGKTGDEKQVGRKSGAAYTELMDAVYESCHRNVKPHGLLIVNVKDHVENGRITRLDRMATAQIEAHGFELVDHKRVRVRPSILRILAETKHGIPHIRHEDFLVFRKT